MLTSIIEPNLEIASLDEVMRFSLASILLYLTCSITSSHSELNALKSSFCMSETIFLPLDSFPFTVQFVFPLTAVLFFIMSFCFARISSKWALYSSAFMKEYRGVYSPKLCIRTSSFVSMSWHFAFRSSSIVSLSSSCRLCRFSSTLESSSLELEILRLISSNVRLSDGIAALRFSISKLRRSISSFSFFPNRDICSFPQFYISLQSPTALPSIVTVFISSLVRMILV